jgi:hypothetical protein
MEINKIDIATKSSKMSNDVFDTSEEFKSVLKDFVLNNKDIKKLEKNKNTLDGDLKDEETKSEEVDFDITSILALFNNLNLAKASDSSLDINIFDKLDELISIEGKTILSNSKANDLENIPIVLNTNIGLAEITNENEGKLISLEHLDIKKDTTKELMGEYEKSSIKISKDPSDDKITDKVNKESIILKTQFSEEENKAPIGFREKEGLDLKNLDKQFNKELDVSKHEIEGELKLDIQMQKGTGDISNTNLGINNVKSTTVGHKNLESIKQAIIDIQKPKTEGESTFINIRLKPDSLGQLNINLKIEKGDLKATMFVQNESTKTAILNQIDELSNSLLKQNITISKFEVKVVNDNLNFDFTKNQSNFNFDSNNSSNTKQNKHYWNETRSEEIETVKLLQYKDYHESGINILA